MSLSLMVDGAGSRDVEPDQFGSAEGAGEAEDQQGAVPLARQRGRDVLEHGD